MVFGVSTTPGTSCRRAWRLLLLSGTFDRNCLSTTVPTDGKMLALDESATIVTDSFVPCTIELNTDQHPIVDIQRYVT
jgi:hypothetical protein